MKKTRSLLKPADAALLIKSMKTIFPTRDELENVLDELEKTIDERLEEKIRFLPTKDDFFTRMDQLSGEIQTVREEQTLHLRQHEVVDERLERVEKKLRLSPLS